MERERTYICVCLRGRARDSRMRRKNDTRFQKLVVTQVRWKWEMRVAQRMPRSHRATVYCTESAAVGRKRFKFQLHYRFFKILFVISPVSSVANQKWQPYTLFTSLHFHFFRISKKHFFSESVYPELTLFHKWFADAVIDSQVSAFYFISQNGRHSHISIFHSRKSYAKWCFSEWRGSIRTRFWLLFADFGRLRNWLDARCSLTEKFKWIFRPQLHVFSRAMK